MGQPGTGWPREARPTRSHQTRSIYRFRRVLSAAQCRRLAVRGCDFPRDPIASPRSHVVFSLVSPALASGHVHKSSRQEPSAQDPRCALAATSLAEEDDAEDGRIEIDGIGHTGTSSRAPVAIMSGGPKDSRRKKSHKNTTGGLAGHIPSVVTHQACPAGCPSACNSL